MKIGIELEFTGISRDHALQVLKNTIGGKVCKAPFRYADGAMTTDYLLEDASGKRWTLHKDRSIRSIPSSRDYQVELITPVLQTPEDFQALYWTVGLMKAAGACVNDSCGMHVHIDGPENAEQLRNILLSFGEVQEEVSRQFSVSKKRLQKYCRYLPESYLHRLKHSACNTIEAVIEENLKCLSTGYVSPKNTQHPARYHMLNIHSLITNGTVEFRFFNGTLNIDEIKKAVSWVAQFIFATKKEAQLCGNVQYVANI